MAGVYLSPGVDGVTVNSEPLLSYFPLAEQRQQVLYPLVLTDMLGGVAVTATVRGGGKTGTSTTCHVMSHDGIIPYRSGRSHTTSH